MDKTELATLFERLLADPEHAEHAPSKAELRAALFAALEHARGDAAHGNGNETAKVAAYLDGALDTDEAKDVIAALLNAPGEIHDLEASRAFLDTLAGKISPAPPELVEAIVSEAEAIAAKPVTGRSRKPVLPLRQWAWIGGAVAAAIMALVIGRQMERAALPGPAPMAAVKTDGPGEMRQAQAAIPKSETPSLAQPAQPPSAGTKVAGLTTPQQTPVPNVPAENAATAKPLVPALPGKDAAQAPQQLALAERAEKEAPPVALALPPPPPPSPALAAAPPPPPSSSEQVLVTGSLIHGAAAVGVPVLGFSAEPSTGAYYRQAQNTEKYPDAAPNPVKIVRDEPVSTFSVTVDTASYSNVRRFLNQGTLPPADAVRVEEMVNYFDYDYAAPKDRSEPFQPTVAVYPSPWNPNTEILHIGIKGFDLPKAERPRANLVFLIDSSGSMAEPNKLPLLKRSFGLLIDQLRPEDRVSIVTYAGQVGVVLPPTPGSEKDKILQALNSLNANGSTAGGEGIRVAYELAEANFDKAGTNRVLLATDGDFNVGITDPNALADFVTRQRTSGVFLTVLGFGVDNYNDLMMQKLAQAGSGNAVYIDTPNEARKVFVDQLAGTLFTIAKDVKMQVEFNPARVAEYRLIGYETRLLNNTDFNNDNVNAGDIGSGHTVTALYEITPVGSKGQISDPLRYGKITAVQPVSAELAYVKIRYKLPSEDESRLITRPVTDKDVQSDFAKLPADLRFAATVAGVGQLLRHDPYIKSFDYDRAIALAQAAKGDDEFGYRTEFVQLLRQAQSIAAPAQGGRTDAAGNRN